MMLDQLLDRHFDSPSWRHVIGDLLEEGEVVPRHYVVDGKGLVLADFVSKLFGDVGEVIHIMGLKQGKICLEVVQN